MPNHTKHPPGTKITLSDGTVIDADAEELRALPPAMRDMLLASAAAVEEDRRTREATAGQKKRGRPKGSTTSLARKLQESISEDRKAGEEIEALDHSLDKAMKVLWKNSPPNVRASLLQLKFRMEQEASRAIDLKAVIDRCEELRQEWLANGRPESKPPTEADGR